MHERYSFAALVFLVPLLPDRRILAIWVVLSLAITANMLLIDPPWLVARIAVIGAGVILALTLVCLWLLTHDGAFAAQASGPGSADSPGADLDHRSWAARLPL